MAKKSTNQVAVIMPEIFNGVDFITLNKTITVLAGNN